MKLWPLATQHFGKNACSVFSRTWSMARCCLFHTTCGKSKSFVIKSSGSTADAFARAASLWMSSGSITKPVKRIATTALAFYSAAKSRVKLSFGAGEQAGRESSPRIVAFVKANGLRLSQWLGIDPVTFDRVSGSHLAKRIHCLVGFQNPGKFYPLKIVRLQLLEKISDQKRQQSCGV